MIEIFASADKDAKGTYVQKIFSFGQPKDFRDKHSFLMRQNKIPRLRRSSDNIKAP